MSDEEFTNESLKKSKNTVGILYEALVSEDGEILDGKHRLDSDPNWPKKNIVAKTRIEKILIRMHAHHRRRVPREETQTMLLELAHELEKTGVAKETISSELAKRTPYSEQYIRLLLPEEYKQPEKVEAAKAGALILAQKPPEQPPPEIFRPERVVFVRCSNCGVQTSEAKESAGKQYCHVCYDKLIRGELVFKPLPKLPLTPPPLGEEAPKPSRVEKKIYEPGAWKEEMHKPVSRMDQWLAEELSRRGIPIEIQQAICIKQVIPEVIIKKGDKPLVVFLDHPETHGKRTLADQENRELLAKKGFRVLELQYDAYTEEQRQLIISEVMSAI